MEPPLVNTTLLVTNINTFYHNAMFSVIKSCGSMKANHKVKATNYISNCWKM